MESKRLMLAVVASITVVQACAQAPAVSMTPAAPASVTATPAAATSASTSPNPLASPTLDGKFPVDTSGRKLAMTCWGKGTPAVFIETGGGAIDEFASTPLVGRLAAETEVCLYNRAGRAPSDPAPNRAREAEDVAADFHTLVRAAQITRPYVLFGRSFGGMVVTFYASKYPGDIAGVVVFDSPAPSATMTLKDFPDGVWNAPGNDEHLNVLTGYENRFGKKPVHLRAPLTLISPTHGESTPDDRYWLQVSHDSKQVVLEGGMDVIDTDADRISEEILSLARP